MLATLDKIFTRSLLIVIVIMIEITVSSLNICATISENVIIIVQYAQKYNVYFTLENGKCCPWIMVRPDRLLIITHDSQRLNFANKH